jgi:hypothetical protein
LLCTLVPPLFPLFSSSFLHSPVLLSVTSAPRPEQLCCQNRKGHATCSCL